MSVPIEIERKYVIKIPDINRMAECENYSRSEIVQIYLESDRRITHRIRSRNYGDKTVYTETKKVRVDEISAFEDEREISDKEFSALMCNIKHGTRPVIKVRHVFCYCDQSFEVDIYPEWQSTCILETELANRDVKVVFPEFIEIMKEVSGDKAYSNAAMSKSFPKEIEI